MCHIEQILKLLQLLYSPYGIIDGSNYYFSQRNNYWSVNIDQNQKYFATCKSNDEYNFLQNKPFIILIFYVDIPSGLDKEYKSTDDSLCVLMAYYLGLSLYSLDKMDDIHNFYRGYIANVRLYGAYNYSFVYNPAMINWNIIASTMITSLIRKKESIMIDENVKNVKDLTFHRNVTISSNGTLVITAYFKDVKNDEIDEKNDEIDVKYNEQLNDLKVHRQVTILSNGSLVVTAHFRKRLMLKDSYFKEQDTNDDLQQAKRRKKVVTE